MKRVDDIFNSMIGTEVDYTGFCDWIESDGNGQYIDTGVVPNNNTRVICEYFFRSDIPRAFIFAARTANGVAQYVHRGLSGGQATANFGDGATKTFGAVIANTRYTVDANKNVWTLTDDQLQPIVITFSEQTFVTNCTLLLFALNNNGISGNADPSVIVSVKIYDNDVLVRDYHPYVDKGIAGMLDVVNDVFKPSANGINFLYGFF